MPEYDELLANVKPAARTHLTPILRDVVKDLELDRVQMLRLSDALTGAFLAGMDEGRAETMAQAAEKGIHLQTTFVEHPDDAPST
jgi:hypothetical protein